MDKIFELVFQQNLPWGVTLLIFLIIFGIKELLHHLEYIHSYLVMRERNKIDDLLNKRHLVSNSELRYLIQESVDEYVFRQCSGISTSSKIRKEIIRIHIEHDIELFHLKRAIRFIKLNNEKIDIEISIWDKIERFFNISFAAILFLSSIYLTYMALHFINELNWKQISIVLFMIFSFILFGSYVLIQNRPLYSATLLKQKLNK